MLLLPERKLHDWRIFDQEEPIGRREARQQLAALCAHFFNVHRKPGTPAKSVDEFMLQTVEDYQERQLHNMLSMLGATAKLRPPGYKRKRPRRRPK